MIPRRMRKLHFPSFALLFIYGLFCSRKVTCENIETSLVKLDLAKHSISNAKTLYPQCKSEASDTSPSCSQKNSFLASLNIALTLITEAEANCRPCPVDPYGKVVSKPIDCYDVQSMGYNKSGIYRIWPRSFNSTPQESIEVYCDMETEGGGWTVIQRRGKFSKQEDFYLDWQKYKTGFGNLEMEFWIGNDNIYSLTHQGLYQARFDLKDVKGEKRFATYDTFWIENENANYKLHVEKYNGNAGDAMAQSNLAMFSTKDKKNDRSGADCTTLREGAFWYYNCCKTNPNGLFKPGTAGAKTMYWYYWRGWDCLEAIEIKIRRY